MVIIKSWKPILFIKNLQKVVKQRNVLWESDESPKSLFSSCLLLKSSGDTDACSDILKNGCFYGLPIMILSTNAQYSIHIEYYMYYIHIFVTRSVCYCVVKSLTSEAIPLATQFFMRAYKISHFSGL